MHFTLLFLPILNLELFFPFTPSQAKELAAKPTNTLVPHLEFPTVTPRPMLDLKDANLNVHEVVEPARVTRSRLMRVQPFFCVVMFYIFDILKTCGEDVFKFVNKRDENFHPVVTISENTRAVLYYPYNLVVCYLH